MRSLIILLSLSCQVGCAYVPPFIPAEPGETITPMQTEPIVVNYMLVAKKINYQESMLKLIYVEEHAKIHDISGIWATDPDLTKFTVTRLLNLGFNAKSLYQLDNAQSIQLMNQHFARMCEQNSESEHPEIPGTLLLPPKEFFLDMQDLYMFQPLFAKLKSKGIRYYMHITAMDLYANAIGYGMVTVVARPNLSIIDINKNKVVWSSHLGYGEVFGLDGDLKRLEKDNLAMIKQAMKTSIEKYDFRALWFNQ